MSTPEHKKEFQLERFVLFSDAVFAIAATLLVIEIKVPELHGDEITEVNLINSLLMLFPKFIGFFISFLVIGVYWTVHHRLFGYVIDYDARLMWINILFLLGIVFMPFSTAFYSEYLTYFLNTPVLLYVSNFVYLGLMNVWMLLHVSNPKRGLSRGLENRTLVHYYLARSLFVPLIFISMGVVNILNPWIAVFVPPLIPVLILPVQKYFQRKLKQGNADHYD